MSYISFEHLLSRDSPFRSSSPSSIFIIIAVFNFPYYFAFQMSPTNKEHLCSWPRDIFVQRIFWRGSARGAETRVTMLGRVTTKLEAYLEHLKVNFFIWLTIANTVGPNTIEIIVISTRISWSYSQWGIVGSGWERIQISGPSHKFKLHHINVGGTVVPGVLDGTTLECYRKVPCCRLITTHYYYKYILFPEYNEQWAEQKLKQSPTYLCVWYANGENVFEIGWHPYLSQWGPHLIGIRYKAHLIEDAATNPLWLWYPWDFFYALILIRRHLAPFYKSGKKIFSPALLRFFAIMLIITRALPCPSVDTSCSFSSVLVYTPQSHF